MAADPAAYIRRIDTQHQLRTHQAGDRMAECIGQPGSMEAELRTRCRADALARNDAEHQRASGQARAVNDYVLSRAGHGGVGVHVLAELAATILGNNHIRRCRGGAGRRQNGAEQARTETHAPLSPASS